MASLLFACGNAGSGQSVCEEAGRYDTDDDGCYDYTLECQNNGTKRTYHQDDICSLTRSREETYDESGTLKTHISYQSDGETKKSELTYYENGNTKTSITYKSDENSNRTIITEYESGNQKVLITYETDDLRIRSVLCSIDADFSTSKREETCTAEKHGCTQDTDGVWTCVDL